MKYFSDKTVYVTNEGTFEPNGIFNLSYLKVENGIAGTSTLEVSVFYKLADLPSDPVINKPTSILIRGILYKATEVKSDLNGGRTLKLHKK